MSLWGGYFCFQNMMGQDIQSGTATHWTTDWGAETIDLSGLGNGQQSSSVPFKTSTSDTDRWSFHVTLADGSTYIVAEKDCGFESEDAGKTVILQAVISGSNHTFTVIMPVSSSCNTSF